MKLAVKNVTYKMEAARLSFLLFAFFISNIPAHKSFISVPFFSSSLTVVTKYCLSRDVVCKKKVVHWNSYTENTKGSLLSLFFN